MISRLDRVDTLLTTLVALLALVACGTGTQWATLEELATDQETYDGRTVITAGTVRAIEDGGADHFVLEDSQDHRVRLLPDEVGAQHVGQRVEAQGEFEFDPERGRLLHVRRLGQGNVAD